MKSLANSLAKSLINLAMLVVGRMTVGSLLGFAGRSVSISGGAEGAVLADGTWVSLVLHANMPSCVYGSSS